MKPMEIEKRSFEIIQEELGDRKLDPEYDLLIRRVIHTTADFEYVDTLAFSDHAMQKLMDAIRRGCDIVTDTTMAMSGINKKTLADRLLLREKALTEQDERNRSMHLRSGGFVMDAMLLVLYMATMLTGMYSMAAFNTAFWLLIAAIALKAGAFWLCSRNG